MDHHALGPSKVYIDIGNFGSSAPHTLELLRLHGLSRFADTYTSAMLRIPCSYLCLFGSLFVEYLIRIVAVAGAGRPAAHMIFIERGIFLQWSEEKITNNFMAIRRRRPNKKQWHIVLQLLWVYNILTLC